MEGKNQTNMKSKIKVNLEEKDVNSFAYQISKIRKDKNLTQKQLAEKLGVSDRTISKWEKGDSTPDGISIYKICNELGISPNAIVLQKKTPLDYIRYTLKCISKFLKFIGHNILIIIAVIVFILLFLFFINNYKAVTIYKLNYNSSDNITVERGYFIKSKVRSLLLIDNISINKIDYEIDTINLELYTLVNADKIIIYESDSLDDIVIDELNDYPTVLKSDIINSMKNNLHLEINVTDTFGETHHYKALIFLKEYFSNDKIAYQNYPSELTQTSLPTYSNKIITDLDYNNETIESFDYSESDNLNNEIDIEDKLSNIGYTYNPETNTYNKTDGIKNIEYNLVTDTLVVKSELDGYDLIAYYYISKDRIDFKLTNDMNVVNQFKYLVDKDEIQCSIGDCDNYISEIDYILNEYQEILTTLQS